jgi:predicted chitinase
MTETTTSKVEKWSYPLKIGTAEATDPQQFYKALAKAKDGYYPLGANGLWHGGIHFDEDTGLAKDLTEVRCIADGEVVAYRIDEAYPKSDFGSAQSIYSTGFVLVKHRLEVPAPPAPPPAQGTASGAPLAAGPSLTFYSLYMHLLDWDNYKRNPTLTPPGFWGKGLYKVKASAPDKALGLRVRSGNSGQHPVVAVLPRGTTVVTQPAPAAENWVKIVSVVPEFAGLPADTGWVFKGQLKDLGEGKYLVGNDALDSLPGGAQHGANVRSAHTSGLPLSHLPPGTQIRLGDDATPNKFKKLVEIVSGSSNPALTPGTDGKLPGFIWSDSLEPMSEPHRPLGSVISLSPSFKIKAGQVLGHIGKYQNHSDAAPKNLLHLEVFCCEDIHSFVTQSQSKAGALPADQKNLMKVYKGTKLISHRADITSSNPPKVSDEGVQIGYDLVIPVSVLEAMPAEKKIKEGAAQWWRLEGLLGDDQGNPISGWLREQDLMTTRHNSWEWVGFEFIEETASNTEHLAANLHDLNLLTEDEKASFVPKASTSTNGPVKERLYNIIDTDKNDKLTVTEIRTALAKPWFAQSISLLATKYESEWLYKAEKWDALDELMGHTAAHPNLNWVAEKKRIEKLGWWGELVGKEGLSADGKIWHIHSIGLVGNFASVSSELISKNQMERMFPSSSDSKREEVRELFNRYAARFEINTPARISQFFAQVKTEVGAALVGKSESLWYSVSALKSLFKRYFDTYPAEAEELGYKRIEMAQYNALSPAAKSAYTLNGGKAYSQLPKPDEIAKRVYCCCSAAGNFVLTSGGCAEGLSYKGKGFIQLTWKANYKAVEDVLKAKLPEETIDIVANPDQLLDTKIGLLSAMGFWEWQHLNNKVAPNVESTDNITKIVNLKTESYAERRTHFTEIYQVFSQ